MADPAEPRTTSAQAYRQGVEFLLQGRPEDAIVALADSDPEQRPEARLALGKAYLELRDGAAAATHFRILLNEPPADPGMLGYLHLLAASANALSGEAAAAESHLDAAQRADPRMEHAVRDLRRRLAKDRTPIIHF